jgi:hypothetical protein
MRKYSNFHSCACARVCEHTAGPRVLRWQAKPRSRPRMAASACTRPSVSVRSARPIERKNEQSSELAPLRFAQERPASVEDKEESAEICLPSRSRSFKMRAHSAGPIIKLSRSGAAAVLGPTPPSPHPPAARRLDRIVRPTQARTHAPAAAARSAGLQRLVLALVVVIQINQLANKLGPTFVCDALRMINLDAPQMALQGDTIRLTCSFSLANEAAAPRDAADENDGAEMGASPTRAASSKSSSTSAASSPNNNDDNNNITQSTTRSSDKRFDELSDQTGRAESKNGRRVDLLGRRRRRRRRRRRSAAATDLAESTAPETLYAIKWYKDEREFYRFVTRDWPHKRALPMAGLDIDVSLSGHQLQAFASCPIRALRMNPPRN